MSRPARLQGMPTDVVDLGALKHQTQTLGPDKLDVEVFIRYGANFYADVNDAVPMFGIAGDDGAVLPALSLIHEDGSMHLYVLEPPMLAMLRSALGIGDRMTALLEEVLDGNDEAIKQAQGLVAAAATQNEAEAAEEAPTESAGDAPAA